MAYLRGANAWLDLTTAWEFLLAKALTQPKIHHRRQLIFSKRYLSQGYIFQSHPMSISLLNLCLEVLIMLLCSIDGHILTYIKDRSNLLMLPGKCAEIII